MNQFGRLFSVLKTASNPRWRIQDSGCEVLRDVTSPVHFADPEGNKLGHTMTCQRTLLTSTVKIFTDTNMIRNWLLIKTDPVTKN